MRIRFLTLSTCLILTLCSFVTSVEAKKYQRFPLTVASYLTKTKVFPGERVTYSLSLENYLDGIVDGDELEKPQVRFSLKSLNLIPDSIQIFPEHAATCSITEKIPFSIFCNEITVPARDKVFITFTVEKKGNKKAEVKANIDIKNKQDPDRYYRYRKESVVTIEHREPKLDITTFFSSRLEGKKPIGTYNVVVANPNTIDLAAETFTLTLDTKDLSIKNNSLVATSSFGSPVCSAEEDKIRCNGIAVKAGSQTSIVFKVELEREKKSVEYKQRGSIFGEIKVRSNTIPFKFNEEWKDTYTLPL